MVTQRLCLGNGTDVNKGIFILSRFEVVVEAAARAKKENFLWRVSTKLKFVYLSRRF